ncbi:TerB family tellurite resistance protein [uncultured Paracoccus sp.]|uniref:tellurite resistance TerB family protein n=1 Tax=uncultured Paracoccus sp. TaxID=189685 RepID=UPI00263642FF|nr:TerB family tellurite resistance protein [uncultured Paracoccus sp.]
MFRSLLSRLFTDETDQSPLAADDADVAVAALLVRLARSDDRYSDTERRRIDKILMQRHHLNAENSAEYRAAAEMIEAEAPDTVRFTRLIKARVPLENRVGIISSMWEVAYADGDRSASEDAMIRLAANLLGVTDRESAVARQEVEESQLPD